MRRILLASLASLAIVSNTGCHILDGTPPRTDLHLNDAGGPTPEPVKTQKAGLSAIYHSPVLTASYPNHTFVTMSLPYNMSTAACMIAYKGGTGWSGTTDDTDGSHTTGFVATYGSDGNWLITGRAFNPGDNVLIGYNCLPYSSFSRGVPTRTGFGGVVSYNGGTVTGFPENPWTTFYAPMSVWGGTSDAPAADAGFGIEATFGASPTLYMAATSVAGHVTGMQAAGYSWSPFGCDANLGRHSSGGCIYLPTGENQEETPISPCDFVSLSSIGLGGALCANNGTCNGTINTTSSCPGSSNAFCGLTGAASIFATTRSEAEVDQIGVTPKLLLVGDTTTMPVTPTPQGRLDCLETVF